MPAMSKTTRRSGLERDALVLWWQYLPRYVVRRMVLHTLERDDAVSIGTIALLRAAELWDPDERPFHVYAIRAIRNSVLTAEVRATRKKLRPLVQEPATVASSRCSSDATWALRGLEELRTRQWHVLHCYFMRGMRVVDIAAKRGSSRQAVDQRIGKALKALRKVLNVEVPALR